MNEIIESHTQNYKHQENVS